jgi:hypothetical protein
MILSVENLVIDGFVNNDAQGSKIRITEKGNETSK